jgi:hypothetical protein
VGWGKAEVRIERFSDQIVRVTHNALSWVHCANVIPRDGVAGVYNQTVSSLSKMRGQLAKLDVGFDHIIRTWFYLGGIVADEGETQRYKELNRARSPFFEGVEFLAGCQTGLPQPLSPYPASTGIGTEGRGLMLSCIALATDWPDIVAMPLDNPRQTSAFDYASYSPKSPKFARALALTLRKVDLDQANWPCRNSVDLLRYGHGQVSRTTPATGQSHGSHDLTG